MTSDSEILSGVREVLRDRLRLPAQVEPGTHLLRDLRLDSIQQLTLVVELENHFLVCFEPGDEADIHTVADVVALVRRRMDPPRARAV